MSMTEAEWLAATEPYGMLDFLRPKASVRKLRLFACGCCRQGVWPLLGDARSREAIEVAERFAEGAANRTALRTAWLAARAAATATNVPVRAATRHAATAAAHAAYRDRRCARGTAGAIFSIAYYGVWPSGGPDRDGQRAAHLALVRCVFDNPFRRRSVDPAWLTWREGTVSRLARLAYDERQLPEGALDPVRLALLADALEDAGCSDAELLAHLRSPGPHARGCWALDLVFGKE
jgi:hypothetical protein